MRWYHAADSRIEGRSSPAIQAWIKVPCELGEPFPETKMFWKLVTDVSTPNRVANRSST